MHKLTQEDKDVLINEIVGCSGFTCIEQSYILLTHLFIEVES